MSSNEKEKKKPDRKEQWETVKWILWECRSALPGVIVLTFFGAVLSASSVGSALLFRRIVDSAVGHDRHGFFFFVACYTALCAADILLRVIRYHYSETVGYGLEQVLKRHFYESLLRADYGSLTQWHMGELMNYFSGDVDTVLNTAMSFPPSVIATAVSLVGSMAILISWDWRFCLLYVAAGIFSALISGPLRRMMKEMQKSVREHYDELFSYVHETVENVLVVRAFGAEDRALKQMKQKQTGIKRVRRRRNVFSNFCSSGFACTLDAGYLFALCWGGLRVIDGSLTYGTLTAVLYLVGRIQGPLSGIGSYLSTYYALCNSAERLRKLWDMQREEEYRQTDADTAERAARDLRERFDRLTIRDLGFSYGREPVFRHASMEVKRGEFIAFTGKSGIGKTTLFKLLLALYRPNEGTLTVETKGEEPIEIAPATRSLFGYVPQGNFLMSGTIANCVRFLPENDKPTEEERKRVSEACRIACAEEFIRQMPDSYDTVVGEHGVGLSEGQAQRIAIARAVYLDAPVLLLDEATSALDSETEKQVLENLRTLKDKTVLIVTHRERALSVCDRTVEIRNGALAAHAVQ